MKLNADIIFDNLRESVMIESHGHKKRGLALERPELYNGLSREFKSNHIYISLADRLPLDPVFGTGVVIICVGGRPAITYFADKCVCFLIKGNTDLFTVFNLVQQIFNKFDEWDAGLQSTLNTNASIRELIDLSFTIFKNPILVMDSSFRYLAYSSVIDTQDELATFRPDENGILGLNELSEYLSSYGMNMTITEPLLLTLRNEQYLSINLFDNDIYTGSLTIPCILRQQRESDIVLVQYLAEAIESSIKKQSTILSSDAYIIKGILQDLLNCFPVDSTRMQYLENGNVGGRYVCAKMAFGYRSNKVPVDYICSLMESSFPGSITFEYESAILSFIDFKKLPFDEDALIDRAKELLQSMNLKAGVSHSFTNLSMARLYYRQACVAFEMGFASSPALNYYRFHDFVLPYMMSHCMGEFPQELLLTKGVCRLLEHDLVSHANYIHTLRTYLNNNMNITKTAEDLYVHRSTFLERLKRIKSLLQVDLDDPDQRLRLLISLKIIETDENIVSRLNSIGLLNSSGFNP